jgi:hypothetical protein
MHDRSALGPADVTDEQLAWMVADVFGADPATTVVLDSSAVEFPYDLPAITTAGRYWVSGTAGVAGAEKPFRLFVKHVQSWARHPFFQLVPAEYQQAAAESVPWRTEALAYRSDLRERLPEGLTMPRAVGVFDLDEASNAVWLEEVPVVGRPWDLARYRQAARLLGRHATSAQVMELLDSVGHTMTIRTYHDGRLSMQVLPTVRDEGVWQHPLVAGAFDEVLHARLLAAADRSSEYADELDAITKVASHGDACPNNLLSSAGSDGFTLIDFGFWGPGPIGFDLAQLLVGDVQIGRRGSEDLAEIDEAIFTGYMAGLRDEECWIPDDVVRRAHALHLLIFTGLSTLPFDLLDAEPTPELHRVAAHRAAIARFSLDLVDQVSSSPG